jgi:endogenous inhibitor of DNA gyrase (YacG/DUF329 family)
MCYHLVWRCQVGDSLFLTTRLQTDQRPPCGQWLKWKFMKALVPFCSPQNSCDLCMFVSQSYDITGFFWRWWKNMLFQGQITPTRLGSKATPQCVVAVIQRLQPSLVHSLVGWSYVHLGKSIGGSSHDLPRRCRMVTRVAVNAANAASQDSENEKPGAQ